MAAIAVSLNSILAARYQTGGLHRRRPEIKKKSINYVKPDAAVQDLFDVINSLIRSEPESGSECAAAEELRID